MSSVTCMQSVTPRTYVKYLCCVIHSSSTKHVCVSMPMIQVGESPPGYLRIVLRVYWTYISQAVVYGKLWDSYLQATRNSVSVACVLFIGAYGCQVCRLATPLGDTRSSPCIGCRPADVQPRTSVRAVCSIAQVFMHHSLDWHRVFPSADFFASWRIKSMHTTHLTTFCRWATADVMLVLVSVEVRSGTLDKNIISSTIHLARYLAVFETHRFEFKLVSSELEPR